MIPVLLAVLIVIAQTAAGAFWWRLFRGTSVRLLEAIGMGMALGTAAATTSGVLLFRAIPGGWAWALPIVVTIVVAPFAVHRNPALLRTRRDTPWGPALLALVVGGTLGMASIAINLRNYPLHSDGMITTYHPDMLFFEALSTSLARLGPADSIFMSGADLRYHWFAYAWSGQVAQTAGTEAFVMLTRVLPIVALVGSLLLAVAWTQRLTRGRWAPTLAAILIVFGGYVGASYGTLLNFDSPSQALVTVWMLGLCIALLSTVRRRGQSGKALAGLLIVVAVLTVATTGGKINSAVVVLVGWLAVTLVALARREAWRARAAVTAGIVLLSAGATYLAFIAGSAEKGGLGIGSLLNKASSVQGLNPSDSRWGVLLGTAIFAIAVFPRWAGVAWLVAMPRWRWQPLTVFSVGVGVAGIGALLLFSGGINDSWFALSASAPLSVASAVGVSRAVQAAAPSRGWRPSRAAAAAVGCGVLLTVLVLALWSRGPDGAVPLRWAGPLVALGGAILAGWLITRVVGRGNSRPRQPHARTGLALALTVVILVTMGALGRLLSFGSGEFAVQPGSTFSTSEFRPFDAFTTALDQRAVTTWSASQSAAASYLREHMAGDELLGTNIAFSALVPALTGQPTYVSAIQYQAPYGRPSQLQPLLERERLTFEFTGSPTAMDIAPLCAANVGWLWVDPERSPARDWEPWATIVVDEPDVLILRVNRSAC